MRYTAEVNSFMPAFTIPFLAWIATAAELFLGITLILGVWPRWVAFGSALLLALFGTAMGISFGVKSPLDHSVFSASAAAALLALHEDRRRGAISRIHANESCRWVHCNFLGGKKCVVSSGSPLES